MAFDRVRNGVTVTIHDTSGFGENEWFYIWGQNCKNLDMTPDQTGKAFSSCSDHSKITSANFDDFWNGYHSIT